MTKYPQNHIKTKYIQTGQSFAYPGPFEDTVCDLVLWGSFPKPSYLICHLNSSLGSSGLEVGQPSPSLSRLCLLLTYPVLWEPGLGWVGEAPQQDPCLSKAGEDSPSTLP